MLYMKGAAASTPKRNPNEDAFVFDTQNLLFAVFDGVGGSHQSQEASTYAAKTLAEAVLRIDPDSRNNSDFLEEWLKNTTSQIHWDIVGKGISGQTTASILLINDSPYDPEALLLNIGDSRIYGWNKASQRLIQLTSDDNAISDHRLDEVESHDQMSESMKLAFNFRNMITRALGCEDIGQFEVFAIPLENFDGFLLTSDGVHDNLSHREIENFLLKSYDVAEAMIGDLVDFAKNRSEDLTHLRHKADDITALYIHIKPD